LGEQSGSTDVAVMMEGWRGAVKQIELLLCIAARVGAVISAL
jgi:hypothetical protein